HESDTQFKILELLTAFVALVGLPGNTVVLWLLGFRMSRNACSVYILNLAGADFLFLCYRFIHSLTLVFNFDFVFRVINKFLWPLSIFAYISGLSFLSAISTERCLSVLWPIWHRCHRPRHMSTVMCALLWALSLLLSMLEVFHGHMKAVRDPGPFCFTDIVFKHELLLITSYFSHYLTVPWIFFVMFISICYSHVRRSMVPLTRLYATVVLTVLVFFLCGLPYSTIWCLLFWFQKDLDAFVPHFLAAVLLSCANSCANPIIYFFVGSFRQRWWKRRHNLRLVLQRALQDTPEVDEPGESLPGGTLAIFV
uniref:G-protein coupled receptors family 1 profile domain-containing protein n=1 Tax=Myotis lucifugus TaxID=59463 RepID=G1Q0C1_MYOLU